MSKNAIILAGGRATRLGPLAAQLNKSLVSYASKPMLVHQIQALLGRGYDRFVVVTSLDAEPQLRSVIERSLNGVRVDVAIQREARGPIDAIWTGTEYLGDDESTLVIAADTWLDANDLGVVGKTWAGVKLEAAYRSWCWHDGVRDQWVDSQPVSGNVKAFVGVASYASVSVLRQAAALHRNDQGLSGMMNRYEMLSMRRLHKVEIPSWQDMGDIKAIARAKQQHFNTRSFNRMWLDETGYLHKEIGLNSRQGRYLIERQDDCGLFPRTFQTGNLSYRQEHVDLPTLAELYLYWPGLPDMWAECLENVLEQVSDHLWDLPSREPDTTEELLIHKPSKRWIELAGAQPIAAMPVLTVNGEDYLAGQGLLEQLRLELRHRVLGCQQEVTPHGDLSFSNILYSLGTGTFRLVDPRGDGKLSYLYDLGKLYCSVVLDLDAIAHDLFDIRSSSGGYRLNIWPKRSEEKQVMRESLGKYGNLRDIALVAASQMISSAPLHDDRQAMALYCQGVQAANIALAMS